MSNMDFQKAYERQKKAREKADENLENRSRELYEASQSLMDAYQKLKDQKNQILQQEKLAAIGQLSAGVAHEINNPAGFVKCNLQTLKRYSTNLTGMFEEIDGFFGELQINEQHQKQLAEIKERWRLDYILEEIIDIVDDSTEGLYRIETIVKSLKTFARPDKEGNELFSVNECIETTLKLLSNEVKYKATVTMSLADIPKALGKPGAMSQVFLNLIVNAADATTKHGAIHISTDLDDENIRIKVKDNGSGIPQKLLTKIFNPFFSTKDVGHGTGLGLSISHNIVKEHGGRIAIDTQEGVGTEFTIYLPIPNSLT